MARKVVRDHRGRRMKWHGGVYFWITPQNMKSTVVDRGAAVTFFGERSLGLSSREWEAVQGGLVGLRISREHREFQFEEEALQLPARSAPLRNDAPADFNTDKPGQGYSLRMKVVAGRTARRRLIP